MTSYPSQPEFATNRPAQDETVAGALSALLAAKTDHGQAPPLAVASAYFNVGGFGLLADHLEAVGPVRLLLGAEPDDHVQHLSVTPIRVLESLEPDPLMDEAADRQLAALAQDRNLLGFNREADSAARRLVAWLRTHEVEVRRLTTAFLREFEGHRNTCLVRGVAWLMVFRSRVLLVGGFGRGFGPGWVRLRLRLRSARRGGLGGSGLSRLAG